MYKSLRDGMAKREDYFEISAPADKEELADPFEKKKKEGQAESGQQTLDIEGGTDDNFHYWMINDSSLGLRTENS